MDNEAKLAVFLETLGDGIDVEVARSVLESLDWDLNAAISTMTDSGAPARSTPAPAQQLDSDGYRAPMQTGQFDTLMGPLNPAVEAAMVRQREAEEAERKAQDDMERAAAEKRRRQEVETQVAAQRVQAEKDAGERRRRRRDAELAELRLQADPEALRQQQERQQKEAEEAIERERKEEERRQREDARAEAEAKKKAQEAEQQGRRREEKEKEDLNREKAEAEAKANAREGKNTDNQPKSVDELVQALQALRKKYKDADPAGLATCLQTLRKYLDNLARNPSEPKFQRINCENAAFKTRVAAFDGAIAVLKACGFRESEGGQLAMGSTKGSSLWDALPKVDVIITEAQAKAAALGKSEVKA